ncbi:amidohydrolase [Vibrio sp. SCSIO 43137]|uniref:amidohydrolase n=1 Tax=Vibrio sp. SCSIO 43137 TaxID=3021011 RepID=UPI0023070B74|nr:amidohydrolase [Vibrio sp. SCSIO 43137]WCE29049.1 amidohydrolase [Vibrio sp. SCSIO 43137]
MTYQPTSLQSFDAVQFRHQLHKHPELSECEFNTAETLVNQLKAFGLKPEKGIGGNGIVCVIDSGKEGETTLLRADFDALPIQEKAHHDHVSETDGVMHACGHDGHTSSMMLVAKHFAEHGIKLGKLILLFQPAEETGTGAAAMLRNPLLKELSIDSVFAYHNLPGEPLGRIVLKSGTFACASTGVAIEFQGKTSHAARPENGLSPANVMMETSAYLQSMPAHYPEAFSLVTLVHARLGEEAFGVAPGYAKVMATLRSDCNITFSKMKSDLQQMLAKLEMDSGISVTLKWDEPFNAAVNSAEHVAIVAEQAEKLGMDVKTLAEPIRWSEDFSEFLMKWPGALFCIGSGESHPQLHNPDYDFPDEVLEKASSLFIAIAESLHGSN